MAGRATAERMRVEARRTRLAQGVLAGLTNWRQLAKAAGMELTNSTKVIISRERKALREEWKAQRLRCFDTDFGREEARILRLIALAEREFRKSVKPSRKRVRKYDNVCVIPAVPGEPAVTTDDGVLIREATPGTAAVFQRVLVEQTTTVEERTGDPRYLNTLKDLAGDLRELLGLIVKRPGDVSTSPPVVQFIVAGPPQATAIQDLPVVESAPSVQPDLPAGGNTLG